LRDSRRTPCARMEQRLCRQAADRWPPACDLRQLHWPAQPLGTGDDANTAVPLPAAQTRPQPAAAAMLHVVDAVLAVPVFANHLPVCTALLPLLRSRDIHG